MLPPVEPEPVVGVCGLVGVPALPVDTAAPDPPAAPMVGTPRVTRCEVEPSAPPVANGSLSPESVELPSALAGLFVVAAVTNVVVVPIDAEGCVGFVAGGVSGVLMVVGVGCV